eukprot:m.6878 g.6878  ORF g.6878 m.6878 type:complete len:66 (-) comp5201_c0_seq1:135-332(-)
MYTPFLHFFFLLLFHFFNVRVLVPCLVQMPEDVLDEMVKEVSKVEGVARVMYDLTAKPPGTTEWE